MSLANQEGIDNIVEDCHEQGIEIYPKSSHQMLAIRKRDVSLCNLYADSKVLKEASNDFLGKRAHRCIAGRVWGQSKKVVPPFYIA